MHIWFTTKNVGDPFYGTKCRNTEASRTLFYIFACIFLLLILSNKQNYVNDLNLKKIITNFWCDIVENECQWYWEGKVRLHAATNAVRLAIWPWSGAMLLHFSLLTIEGSHNMAYLSHTDNASSPEISSQSNVYTNNIHTVDEWQLTSSHCISYFQRLTYWTAERSQWAEWRAAKYWSISLCQQTHIQLSIPTNVNYSMDI